MSKLFPVSNELKDNHQLSPFIRSSNQTYSAVIQGDGNFIIYDEVKKIELWSSGTAGKGTGPYHLDMEDGNLVLYDGQHKMQWSSKTEHHGKSPHKLVMDNDGHLRIYDDNGKVFWCVPENTDISKWPQELQMCNASVIQAQAGSTLYCASMKSFTYNILYDSLIVYNFNDVNNPSKYLFNAGTTPINGNPNYLYLDSNGTLGIYSLDETPRIEWHLPADSNAVKPFYMQIQVDASQNVSLRVYGDDINTGKTIIAYSVYPPSS